MPAPSPDLAAAADPVPFTPLTVEQNKVLAAHLTSGWYKQAAVYPALSPLWQDTGQILADLHAAWTIAFDRENNARTQPGYPPAGRPADDPR